LDTELLMRALLGWLRGERKHCQMVRIPTIEEEDARRPNREHQTLVGERTRNVCRIKSTLVLHGIRDFNPKRLKASERLETLRCPEGGSLPRTHWRSCGREMAQLRLISGQLREIEKTREERLKRAPRQGTHPMVLLLAKVLGIGIETADMLVHEILSRELRMKERWGVMPADRLTVRQRCQTARKGDVQGGQCACPARHGPTGLALDQVPKGQPIDAVVQQQDRSARAIFARL